MLEHQNIILSGKYDYHDYVWLLFLAVHCHCRDFYYRHFQESYSRPVCAWYFVRRQNVCCHYNDFLVEICVRNAIMGSDCSSIYRFTFAMLYVLLFANKVKSMSMLLVVGIMISYICSAITDLCITFANDSDIANLTHWAMGSFSGSSWTAVKLAAIVVFQHHSLLFIFKTN